MRILTEAEYQQEALPIMRRVFAENEPYKQPFSSLISEKVIVFPCEILPEPFLVNGLFLGATQIGDIGCYFSQLWRNENQPNDCYIPLSELREVCGSLPSTYQLANTEDLDVDLESLDLELHMNLLLENAFYSATGKWGFMRSHGRFGVLGGSLEFIEAVRQIIPDLDRQVYDFLENYQLSKSVGMRLTLDWLPELLNHIYGQETAEMLLREAELL